MALTSIKHFFEAKSYAIIGATGNKDKLGWYIVSNFIDHFDGEVYLVSPKGGEIEGRTVYKSVTDMTAWQQVIEALVKLSGASHGVVSLRDRQTAEICLPHDLYLDLSSPMTCGLSESAISEYIHHYWKYDPWTEIERKNHPISPYALSTYLPLADSLAKEKSDAIAKIPILLAHGSADPVVPVHLAYTTRGVLQKNGYDIEWHEYQGMPHSVSEQEIYHIAEWHERVLL